MSGQFHSTAGRGDPYWYEWFVGLTEVLKLLDPDCEVSSVAFQVASIDKWDDVVVETVNGRRYYQVKHSREGTNLSFGSLVEKDSEGSSLLQGLFDGWKKSSINHGDYKLVLHTNREVGTRWAKLKDGSRRPPFVKFLEWLEKSVTNVESFAGIKPPKDYLNGWKEWKACLRSGTEAEALTFLRHLELRLGEEDLDQLERTIRTGLAHAFGISIEQAAPLFDALCRALKKWTTGHASVNVEELCSELTIPPEAKDLSPAPPPPHPFFPSRCPIGESIEERLIDASGSEVLFLSGEPGSGKTSLVSWLSNRRQQNAFEGTIGIRFFCFEPIRPENPFIAPDASRVTPSELWLSLLTQLRVGLRGRLHEFQVPLRNDFLDWQKARAHVLRLADALGKAVDRPFVIVIDGIDHAARAAQAMPKQISDFFSSLPTPDELNGRSIRLLIAGQPPEYYKDQYPLWLQSTHPGVKRVDLPQLEDSDIKTLLLKSRPRIPSEQIDETVRLIEELTRGNTLAVVFAVAEAESQDTLEALRTRLEARRLASGVEEYYRSIWQFALRTAPELGCALAGSLSLARRTFDASFLQAAFSNHGLSVARWQEILADLRPLLFVNSDCVQVRHNDVRVFLSTTFSAYSEEERQGVASSLSDHLRSNDADRDIAHLQLFDLLRLAGRELEFAQVFTTEWVLEGVALGIELEQLRSEGSDAVRSLSANGSWADATAVACALQTLSRISSDYDALPPQDPRIERNVSVPSFLPSEACVKPIADWTTNDLLQLASDADDLCDAGQMGRAAGLISRWLDGIGTLELLQFLPDATDEHGWINNGNPTRLNHRAESAFGILGRVYGSLGVPTKAEALDHPSEVEYQAQIEFDESFVNCVSGKTQATSLDEAFPGHRPKYVSTWETAARKFAEAGNWTIVAEILRGLEKHELSDEFLAEATWFALKCSIDSDTWKSALTKNDFGLSPDLRGSHSQAESITPHLLISRALGWTRTDLDAGDIAETVVSAMGSPDEIEDAAALKLLFRTSAMLGRLERAEHTGDLSSAAAAFDKSNLKQVLTALWGTDVQFSYWRSSISQTRANLANELADYSGRLGEGFLAAVVDAALPFAEEKVLGDRVAGIWDVVKKCGRGDLLRDWIDYYLKDDGQIWSWSHYEIHETLSSLVPLAKSVGLTDIADKALDRSRLLLIDYRDRKEYSFEQIASWIKELARIAPSSWEDIGWRLWKLCGICRQKRQDNEYQLEILASISSAAIRCGPGCWWQLIQSSLDEASDTGWHWRTRELLIQGVCIASELSNSLVPDDIGSIWATALAFSYWFDPSDNSSLRHLLDGLQRIDEPNAAALADRYKPFLERRSSQDDDGYESEAEEHRTLTPPSQEWLEEEQFWSQVDQLGSGVDEREFGFSGLADDLFRIIRRRAFQYGEDTIREGLNCQLDMHARWIFGQGNVSTQPTGELAGCGLPDDWEGVAIQLLQVLFTSHSAEVLSSALEGMDFLVESRPASIAKILEKFDQQWARHWLLNAAELWAVRHPGEIAHVRGELLQQMSDGILADRLQAWVVLARNADTTRTSRPDFPISDTPDLDYHEGEAPNTGLLHVPPLQKGHVRFSVDHAAAESMLKYCEYFGFKFRALEGLVAEALSKSRALPRTPLEERGPRRYDDMQCTDLDVESAVGGAIVKVLSSDWCGQEHVALLAQATLANEEAWVYRTRPQPVEPATSWIADGGVAPDDPDFPAIEKRLVELAVNTNLPPGWKTFAARIVDFTHRHDIAAHLWFEKIPNSQLIRPARRHTCPGGRTFSWWIGEPYEQAYGHFVSGLFVGGRQRLHFSHVEIRPPRIWRDQFGWQPLEHDPLTWSIDGTAVATYQRIHATLRDTPERPHYRLPMLDRWIVTDQAFEQAERILGRLRMRHDFEVAEFSRKG